MAKMRQIKVIPPGEYQATIFWLEGSGLEQRERHAEYAGVKVDEKWVYIHLRDGEEIIRLLRRRNGSAQVYISMGLREAMREKIVNNVENSSRCCWGQFGMSRGNRRGEGTLGASRTPCAYHTAKWLEAEIEDRIGELTSDDDWPAILCARKKNAEQQMLPREAARAEGVAEWRKRDGDWVVYAEGRQVGDIVTVRRRSGSLSKHELVRCVADDLYLVGPEIRQVAA
jgi:hypothetical protein